MPRVIKDFYLIIIILYSGKALGIYDGPYALISILLLGIAIFGKQLYPISKKFIGALVVWMAYFGINTYLIGSFHPYFMLTYIAKISIAFMFLSYYRSGILKKYEDIIFSLVLISLIFYALQLLVPDLFSYIIETIDISGSKEHSGDYASIGIYTHLVFAQKATFMGIPRNAGFTWEPGPFSSFVALAIFFNLARNGVKIKDKFRLTIFIIAIITTQSSTGFVLLLTIMVWYGWSRFKNPVLKISLLGFISFVVAYLFFATPFLHDKIKQESEQDIEQVIANARQTGKTYNPGRFSSFALRIQDFMNYPIAGFGGNTKLQVGYLGKDNVVSATSGIGNIIGRYGSIGTLIFLMLIFTAGRWLGNYYNYSAHIIFPILILMIGFGFSIIETPIIVTMWMIPVFLGQIYLRNNTESR